MWPNKARMYTCTSIIGSLASLVYFNCSYLEVEPVKGQVS